MSKAHHARGFTLVELLGGLVILSIGLLAMAKMQISSIQGNAFGGRMTTAIVLAQDQMERLINQSLDPWPVSAVTGSETSPSLLGRTYAGYSIDWSVTPDAPIPDVATLSVQVQWPGGPTPIRLTTTKRR